eukprot:236877_1
MAIAGTYPPLEWITMLIFLIIATIINSWITYEEIQKRNKNEMIHASKYLQLFSIVCLIGGIIGPFSHSLYYIPDLCHFVSAFGSGGYGVQVIFMGYYQLSRLHYCFANTQIHSNKGYPTILFIILFMIGGLLLIYVLFMGSLEGIILECGYDSKLNFIAKQYALSLLGKHLYIRHILWIFIYTLWDLFTLCLLFKKFRKINIGENKINNKIELRINYVLFRIVLCTMLYEIPTIFLFISTALYSITNVSIFSIMFNFWYGFSLICMNYSMYLMQEHNANEYTYFLKIIKQYKIYFIFCCVESISGSLKYEEETCQVEVDNDNKDNDNNKDNIYHDSVYETRTNTTGTTETSNFSIETQSNQEYGL